MKSKILLTFFILMFTWLHIDAQAHDNSRGACKLFKNKAIEEGASCPGCVAKDKKEQAARDVVNKKRQDIATAKANAERLAKETAYKKEMAERKAKEKVTEVKVVMPKTSKPVSASTKKTPMKASVKKDEILMISNRYGGFENVNGDVIIPKDAFFETFGAMYYDNINRYDFPKGVGIVALNDKMDQSRHPAYNNKVSTYNVMDLIDSKSQRYFNSDAICLISHFFGDWFLIGYDYQEFNGPFNSVKLGGAKLFNIRNKKEFTLPVSPFDNGVYLKHANYEYLATVNLEKVLYKNPDYISGTYVSTNKDRRLHEKLLDISTGGSENWKAFISLSVSPSRSQTESRIIYLSNADEIKEITITNEQRIEFLRREQ